MEEPILHEQTKVSPLMLSMIVHCTLVLLFIIEMNMADSSLPTQSEAEVIMMPEANMPSFSQTGLAATPEPITQQKPEPTPIPPSVEEEDILKNFPSFVPTSGSNEISENTTDISKEQTSSADTDEMSDPTTLKLRRAPDEQAEEPEEQATETPTPAQSPTAEVPALTPPQYATSLVSADQIDQPKLMQPTDQNGQSKLQAAIEKKLSLADIGKKHQEYLRDERSSNAKNIAGVTILGDDNAIATGDQIKLARFLEKINNQITKAWNRAPRPRIAAREGKYESIFYMAINKNGTLKKLKMVQSTGNTEFDALIANTYKDASDWFPAIPDSFRLESYGFNILYTFYMR